MRKGSIDGVDVTVASAEKLASYEKAVKEVSQFEPPRLHDTHADPHSRLFVALFDGTGNDVVKDPERATNVGLLKKQLEDIAQDDPTIGGFYKEGPGTQGGLRGMIDGAIGGTYQERIEAMYEKLKVRTTEWLEEDPDANIKVVSVGFSRGAEQAAGFSRLVHERGIQSAEDEKQVLRAPGTTPQALALYDPVATGVPSHNDRRPPPSVVSGMQITAGDEHRTQFPSTSIIAQGKSEDGRFLGVTTAGAHSDVGGGYLLNGLSARNFNLMADYLNKTIGDNTVTKMRIPPEPEKSVIHHSTQHKWFYRAVEKRRIIDRAEPTGRLPAEPVDAAIMQKFSGKSVRAPLPGTAPKLDSAAGVAPIDGKQPARDGLATQKLPASPAPAQRGEAAREGSPRAREMAEAFTSQPQADAIKRYPELARAYAAAKAIETAMVKTNHLSAEQAAVVADRVRTNIASKIAKGEMPQIQAQEKASVQKPPAQKAANHER